MGGRAREEAKGAGGGGVDFLFGGGVGGVSPGETKGGQLAELLGGAVLPQ